MNPNQTQAHLLVHRVLNANHEPDTSSQAGTMGASCQTQSMHELICENGRISQRRPRALDEPSNTMVKHMCYEEALLLTFPDLGFDSTNELQQMVGTPCQSQASPRPPTNNHCNSTPHPPVLDLSRTLTNHKLHKVAHWVRSARHNPCTNSPAKPDGISQRRPRALHEPSNTVVKHMCCEEALLWTFPDLGD